MFSASGLKFSPTFYFSFAIAGGIFALFGYILPYFDTFSAVGQIVRNQFLSVHAATKNYDEPNYRVQVFSRDPLVIHIRDFVSSDEIAYLLNISEDKYVPSKVYGGLEDSPVDRKTRVSDSAFMDYKDPVVRRISKRAREFQGWRGNTTRIEPLLVQRYKVNGFYSYHFDWDESLSEGNRATTFMTYLVGADNCTGGGTNFPFLPQPTDTRWCDVIECDEEGRDGYQGVIFKPIVGSAVFWENFYPNGTGHKGVYHAGLPVKSGMKVGLNIWSWDSAWVRPEETTQL